MSLEVTNTDWIEFSTSETGMCILTYKFNKLVKPKNEDADIGYMVMMVNVATEISLKNTGNKTYHSVVELSGVSMDILNRTGLFIKAVKTLEKELPDTLSSFDAVGVKESYLLIWHIIKPFVHKDTLNKITIYTDTGKKISNVENLEKNLSN